DDAGGDLAQLGPGGNEPVAGGLVTAVAMKISFGGPQDSAVIEARFGHRALLDGGLSPRRPPDQVGRLARGQAHLHASASCQAPAERVICGGLPALRRNRAASEPSRSGVRYRCSTLPRFPAISRAAMPRSMVAAAPGRPPAGRARRRPWRPRSL